MCRWFFFFETGEVPSTKLRRGQTRVSPMLLQRKVIHRALGRSWGPSCWFREKLFTAAAAADQSKTSSRVGEKSASHGENQSHISTSVGKGASQGTDPSSETRGGGNINRETGPLQLKIFRHSYVIRGNSHWLRISE